MHHGQTMTVSPGMSRSTEPQIVPEGSMAGQWPMRRPRGAQVGVDDGGRAAVEVADLVRKVVGVLPHDDPRHVGQQPRDGGVQPRERVSGQSGSGSRRASCTAASQSAHGLELGAEVEDIDAER